MNKMKIFKFMFGCILLMLFPIVVIIDLLMSESICGMIVTPEESCFDCWEAWKDTYIKGV